MNDISNIHAESWLHTKWLHDTRYDTNYSNGGMTSLIFLDWYHTLECKAAHTWMTPSIVYPHVADGIGGVIAVVA